MGIEWEETTLADISSDVSYGYTESASDEKVGPRFLRITDIQNGVVNWDNVPYCPISADNYHKYRLHEGDIVIARTGNSTGENFLYQGIEDAVFASYLIRFRIDRKKADPRFIWYNLRSRNWWNFIDNSKTGSAQAGANAKILGRFPLSLPQLEEQRAIAHILGTLDDKIELNRRMNETLEAMTQALFKSWFVDFDPVRAKAEGRNPGLPKEIADLFPNSFEDSELGDIPKAWRIGSILEQAELLSGGTPKTERESYWGGGILWSSAKDVSQCGQAFLITTDRTITEKGLNESATQMIPAFSTVVVARGATTGRMVLFGRAMTMNQTCYALVSKAETPFVLHCQLRHQMKDLVHAAHGSVFDTITTSTFNNARFVLPPGHVLVEFEKQVSPFYRRVLEASNQSRTLVALRNTLLPKLLSGEVRVGDAEPLVSEAIL